MIKVTVFYNKELGELNIASTGKQGRLKILDDAFNWSAVPTEEVENVKAYVNSHKVTTYIVLNNKEKSKLEEELIVEISQITPDVLDVIKNKIVDEFTRLVESGGDSIRSKIINSFENVVKAELERINYLNFHNVIESKLECDEVLENEFTGRFVDITYSNETVD